MAFRQRSASEFRWTLQRARTRWELFCSQVRLSLFVYACPCHAGRTLQPCSTSLAGRWMQDEASLTVECRVWVINNISWGLTSQHGRTTKFAPVRSLRFSELFLGILHSEIRLTVFFPLGFGVDSRIPPIQFFQTAKWEAPKEAWGRSFELMRHQCNFSAPSWVPTWRNALCYSGSDWSKLHDLHPIFYDPLSTLLHPVLASSYPLWQDFSKRASFPIVCVDGFYEKAVRGVVKSWEFEGNLRCSKILIIWRKNPMKWVWSISRDYWVYLDITLQSFKIWKFWGEFWGTETFYPSKFSPATGVMSWGLTSEHAVCNKLHSIYLTPENVWLEFQNRNINKIFGLVAQKPDKLTIHEVEVFSWALKACDGGLGRCAAIISICMLAVSQTWLQIAYTASTSRVNEVLCKGIWSRPKRVSSFLLPCL